MRPPKQTFDRLYLKGIALFNQGDFFDCHEVLEELWFKEDGPNKLFYQGLIQVAVAFYHYQCGNYRGSAKVLSDGIKKLTRYLPIHLGIDLASLVAELELWRQKINAHLSQQSDHRPDLKIPSLKIHPP